MLLSSSPEVGGLPPRPGPGAPGKLLGLCIRACTSELGSRPGACAFLTASHVSARAFHVGSGVSRRNVERKAGRGQGQGRDRRRTPPAPALGDAAAGTGRGAASHPSAVRRTAFLVQRFSLEFGLIQLHNVSECYFVFPKVYELGVAPPPARAWAPQRALASERGRAGTEGPDAARVGKSFRPSQWWDTLPRGQASRVAQTSGSRDCDWHNQA